MEEGWRLAVGGALKVEGDRCSEEVEVSTQEVDGSRMALRRLMSKIARFRRLKAETEVDYKIQEVDCCLKAEVEEVECIRFKEVDCLKFKEVDALRGPPLTLPPPPSPPPGRGAT